TTSYTQNITLGIDSGYNYIGFSAVTEKEELICGEVKLRNDISSTFMFKIETLEAEIFEKSF
ncbi:MAG: RRXRR domain-containing protein, partial [Defluviitoga tunisiensis]|nr:hypothetical protein [Defluviitoga tunisiensis]